MSKIVYPLITIILGVSASFSFRQLALFMEADGICEIYSSIVILILSDSVCYRRKKLASRYGLGTIYIF